MTQSHNFRNLFAVSAIAGTAAIALFGQSVQASASVSKLLDCQASSRNALVLCCANEVRRAGVPEWMRASGQNCRSARVECKANSRLCYYVSTQPIPILTRENGGHDSHGNPNGGRSTNGKY